MQRDELFPSGIVLPRRRSRLDYGNAKRIWKKRNRSSI